MTHQHRTRRALALALVIIVTACGGGDASSTTTPTVGVDAPPQVAVTNATHVGTVGTAFTLDATRAGTAFTDPRAKGLTYTVSMSPVVSGLTAANGVISGTPAAPAVTRVTLTATDTKGSSASQTFAMVIFAAGLKSPTLPATPLAYSDASAPLPVWFTQATDVSTAVTGKDNMPSTNVTTDAGATLGRVLFYDTRVSVNDKVACASCHMQAFGFSDTAKLSRGFDGGLTGRHSMALANARFYASGKFFWDERAATLENQVLMPIQDAVEMGMTLDNLVLKVANTSYYPALFTAAFGTSDVTSDRISKALAQFVRSLVSYQSKNDLAFANPATPNFTVLTAQEQLGQLMFVGAAQCAACHSTVAQTGDNSHATGLDLAITDAGVGGGRFKSPSLRNIAVRAPYMHDGRFTTLEQVVEFYNSGVQATANLDTRLRAPGGAPKQLNLTSTQKAALVAYLGTLTDQTFLTAAKFSNPFTP
jgi:cytochrome c peroxidase